MHNSCASGEADCYLPSILPDMGIRWRVTQGHALHSGQA